MRFKDEIRDRTNQVIGYNHCHDTLFETPLGYAKVC